MVGKKVYNIIRFFLVILREKDGENMTTFHCPTKIFTGEGALDALKDCKAERVLVVTDGYFSKIGKALEIGKMVPGADVKIFDKVLPDPTAELAAEGTALCRTFRPDLLIALGGGSPMDCAKAIRMASGLPMTFYAIPTTAGSGSEVTSFSVLTKDGIKHPLVDETLRPDAAILDSCLLESLPASLVADTGMDLLAHCVEAMAAANRNSFTDALSFHGAMTAMTELPSAYSGDSQARGKLLEAATMAGMAFDNAGLGLCHAAAHVLGGAYHLPHGRLCAMILPHVMAVNSSARYIQFARLCGLSAATERLTLRNLTAAIVRLRSSLGMPATLRQAGIDPVDIMELIPLVLADGCCKTNPVPVTESMVKQVLQAVSG